MTGQIVSEDFQYFSYTVRNATALEARHWFLNYSIFILDEFTSLSNDLFVPNFTLTSRVQPLNLRMDREEYIQGFILQGYISS